MIKIQTPKSPIPYFPNKIQNIQAVRSSSTGKGNLAGPFPTLPSFYQSFRLLGPPGYGPVVRTEGRNGAFVACAVYFSPGRASLTRRLSIGASASLFLCVPISAYLGFVVLAVS
ncbi:hypothetical protein CEXT_744211 [Caerostris extrusa]|uniref:Uncharacterized protein n=1 Tax=Caerostris extrusa TaxID=172846 RepID=A0AAV4Q7V8_CAEEX|nr:hypothetical protein CEXT_744211 [Caerostris extrusa]